MIYTNFIIDALNLAASVAREKFGRVIGTTKPGDNNQVVTEADLAVGKLIIEKIQGAYPNHNIIDEEAGAIDKKSEYTWVIDPIDGTSNFAAGTPLYGIMVGLLKGAMPIAGGIILPEMSLLCTAEKGEGAFCNDEQIFVTKESNLLNCLVAYQVDGHQEEPQKTEAEMKVLGKIVLGVRNVRSSGGPLDPLLVAQGKYGACMNQTSKIWDNVAHHVIMEEAGGIYTDFFGKPMDYSDPISKVDLNFTQCAAAPELHKQLQTIIHQ